MDRKQPDAILNQPGNWLRSGVSSGRPARPAAVARHAILNRRRP
jgi:hypothetical protein